MPGNQRPLLGAEHGQGDRHRRVTDHREWVDYAAPDLEVHLALEQCVGNDGQRLEHQESRERHGYRSNAVVSVEVGQQRSRGKERRTGNRPHQGHDDHRGGNSVVEAVVQVDQRGADAGVGEDLGRRDQDQHHCDQSEDFGGKQSRRDNGGGKVEHHRQNPADSAPHGGASSFSSNTHLLLRSPPLMSPTRRVRVMFVMPDLNVGGAERHIANVVPRLDRARIDARVVCIKEPGAMFDTVHSAGIEAISLDCGRGSEIPRAFRLLRAQARAFRPDVVVTRGFNAEVLGRVATLGFGTSRVVWKRNCGDLHRRLVERVVDRVLDRITDWYFGVAFGQVPYLINELGIDGAKIRIIRNGAQLDRFVPRDGGPRDPHLAAEFGIEPDDRVVGILAVLRPEKDHATFLRGARLLADQLPSAKFLIVGDGECRADLERQTAELGLADRVIFAGMRSDIENMLGLCDVTVLTSYTIECCPNALLEAMASGLPSVCTAIGGVPEMIEEGVTGHLVPPFNPMALAEGLLRVLEPIDHAREMGRAARQRAERHFSLDQSVAEAQWALERVADGRLGAATRS